MLSNKLIFKMFVKVSLLSFVLTWFIYGTYLVVTRQTTTQKSAPAEKSTEANLSIDSTTFVANHEEEKAGNCNNQNTLKPSFGKLPSELFPGNSFKLDFHRLPNEMMTPQSAENTRAATFKLKEMQIAFHEAEKAAKEVHIAEIDKMQTGGDE